MDEIPEDADVVTASETGAFPLGVIVAHVASMLAWCAFGVYDARRARRADPAGGRRRRGRVVRGVR